MSIKFYVFDHDQTAEVNAWIEDRGELPPVAIYIDDFDLAALAWEDCCERLLDHRMPYDGNNDPIYIPEIDRTVYCSY